MSIIQADTGGRHTVTALLMLAATFTVTAFQVAHATGSSDDRLVALHAERGGALIVAYGSALARIDPVSGEQTAIVLPPSVSRVDALATGTDGALYLAGSEPGVWFSRDRGQTWTAGLEGLPSSRVTALAAHANQAHTVYAYVPAEGIYRSEDAGRSWSLMDAGPEDMTGPFVHTDMPGSMQTGWLFAATTHGISRSMDCFCLWREAGELGAQANALAHDPDRPERIFAVTGEGILLSEDGGENWGKVTAPAAEVTALSHAAGGVLYAGTAAGAVYSSSDGAKSWRQVHGDRP